MLKSNPPNSIMPITFILIMFSCQTHINGTSGYLPELVFKYLLTVVKLLQNKPGFE